MTSIRAVIGVAAVVSACALAGSAPAAKPLDPQKATLAALDRAAARGTIDPRAAAAYRDLVNRGSRLIRRLPPARAGLVAAALHQAAALAGRYSTPRALNAFSQLAVNEQYFARRGPPHGDEDVTGPDGAVYRFFPHLGFEFHPLANFAALNAAVAAGDRVTARRLAAALVARGIAQPRRGIGWEYLFDFGSGRAPWLSGMAQAVGAQALAGASRLLDDPSLLAEARGAFRAIPGRLVSLRPGGPWIRLYSYSRLAVLNAQLQAVVSLEAYASDAEDARAAALATSLRRAAAAQLHRFDTGYWTYYALPDVPSPPGYQEFVVSLLKRLGAQDATFAGAAARFAGYETQPPALRLAASPDGSVRFWLSKPATAVVRATGAPKTLGLTPGWHELSWKLPRRAGVWRIAVSLRDSAGNSASFEGLPIVRIVPTPHVKKHRAGGARPLQDNLPRQTPALAPDDARPSAPPAIGAGLDSAGQNGLAVTEDLGLARLTVPWPTNATEPDDSTVASLNRVASRLRLVVELTASPLPAGDVELGAFASYAAALVRQVPGVQDLLLGPPPLPAAAPAYVSALGAVYGAVKAVRPDVRVAGELDGSSSPAQTLAAISGAYRREAAAAPLLDELDLRLAPSPGVGDWTVADGEVVRAALAAAFEGTAVDGATLTLLYDGVSTPSLIPQAKASLYRSAAVIRTGIDEADQAAAYARLVETARCEPSVSAIILERLVDTPDPGGQSGLFYADDTPKASAAAFRQAIRTLPRAGALCPGVSVPAAAAVLDFPDALAASVAPRLALACVQDCVYLVTLDRVSDGRPVLARRGALAGARAPSTIVLPDVRVPPGSYRFTVRLVNQANPGGVVSVRSGPIALR